MPSPTVPVSGGPSTALFAPDYRRHLMITTFDSLYAGHVDMDNVGYAGTAVNDRTYSD